MHSKKNILREWHSYLETIVLAEKNEAIREASATIKKLNADEKIKMQCEAREQLEHDMASAYRHGIDVGEERGMELGENRANQLYRYLIEQKRMEDIVRATADEEYREKLYKEFNL